jgi:hypothetical protein
MFRKAESVTSWWKLHSSHILRKKGKKDKRQHLSGKNVFIFIIIFHVAYRFFQCYAEYIYYYNSELNIVVGILVI